MREIIIRNIDNAPNGKEFFAGISGNFKDFWTLTHLQLAKMFPMFDLSAEGLEAGMKRLMVKR